MSKECFMQKKGNKHHQFQHQQEQQLKFAGLTKLEFVSWLKALSAEERYLTLRVRAPNLTQKTIQLNTKYGECWKLEIENKKISKLLRNFLICLQNFVDGLVLISDKDHLDSIGFDFSFVGCPQKLFDTLVNLQINFNKIKQKQKNLIQKQYLNKLSIQKQQWIEQILNIIQQNYQIKKNKYWEAQILEKQKIQKKQFGNFWKSLNQNQKIFYLYLENHGIQQLIQLFIKKGIDIQKDKLQQQINQLYQLDRKQICNKVFKCKVKKSSTGICTYYQQLYQNWRQYAIKIKNQTRLYGKKKIKNINKRQKSLDAYSNQTNQSQLQDSRVEVSQQNLYKIIQNDVLECTDLISEVSNKFHEKRVLAFERISAILRLYGVSCKLFGSCASGITIKDSDIDIAINEKILKYFSKYNDIKNEMNAALDFMSEIFESLAWVSKQKVIKTASIPIIKLVVHTDIEVTQQYFTEQYRKILNRKVQNVGQVHVDLTIEITQQQTSNHLGVVSTQQINTWLKQIQTLRPIVILLKYQLSKKLLNQTYLGGINTYCLVVLVVCFIYSHGLEKETNVGMVLGKLLNFYGWEFDEKVYGIDLRDKNQIYYEKGSSGEENSFANLQIKDPLNEGKVMTKNCYEFDKVKNIFREIYKYCFVEKENQLKKQLYGGDKKDSSNKIKKQNYGEIGCNLVKRKNYFVQFIL